MPKEETNKAPCPQASWQRRLWSRWSRKQAATTDGVARMKGAVGGAAARRRRAKDASAPGSKQRRGAGPEIQWRQQELRPARALLGEAERKEARRGRRSRARQTMEAGGAMVVRPRRARRPGLAGRSSGVEEADGAPAWPASPVRADRKVGRSGTGAQREKEGRGGGAPERKGKIEERGSGAGWLDAMGAGARGSGDAGVCSAHGEMGCDRVEGNCG